MSNKKIAIITGGGSGIGLGIAKKFALEGIVTYIVGRRIEKLTEAQKNIGDNIRIVQLDISDLKSIPAAINTIAAEHGRIDVLVNNAGINMKKSFFEVTDQEFESIVRTNLTATFSLSREVAKVMKDHKSGSIINISSMTAHYGLPKVTAYSASKTAVEGLTRSMAVDLSPHGIRVNSIAPGFIVTPMTSKAFEGDPARKQRVLDRTPIGSMGTPQDIADAAFFLATESSKFITGECLKVDGGNSIGF